MKIQRHFAVMIFIIALLSVAHMTLSALSPAQAQAQDTGEAKDSVSYVFKPNDTLIGLANRYFKKPDDYKIVQRINAIANPRKIPVGTNVVVPIRLLKIRQAKARIAAYRGQIAITDNNGRALSVRTGQSLAEAVSRRARNLHSAYRLTTVQSSPCHRTARCGSRGCAQY